MKIGYFIKFLKKISRRLSVFDYLSIALIGGVIIALGLFFLRKVEVVEIEVKIAPDSVFWRGAMAPFWLANSINVGDGEFDGFGRKMVEVLDVRTFEGGGDAKYIYLKLNVKAVYDKKKRQFSFGGKPLGVGSPIKLRLSGGVMDGLVTYVKGVPDTRIWEDKIVEVRVNQWTDVFPETLGTMPWRVEAIKIGDQMKDGQGRVVAEILDKEVKPAEKIVVTNDGRVLLRQDPIKKDLILRIKLKTFKQKGINYFLDDQKVKVSYSISLCLPEIDIWPEITRIIE